MTAAPRLHVTGASCAGVTTLGAALAGHLAVPQIDVDDAFWLPTDPPYTTRRPVAERLALIRAQQAASAGWVLSGSLMGWGEALVGNADLVILIWTPTELRLRRLAQREYLRHSARILPGGDMHAGHLAFRDWAAGYDTPGFAGRNRQQHEDWLDRLPCPVLRLPGERPVPELLARVVTALQGAD